MIRNEIFLADYIFHSNGYVSAEELSELLNVSKSTIYHLIKTNRRITIK